MDDAMQDKPLDPLPPDDAARHQHGLKLVFDDVPLLCLIQRDGREGVGIEALCAWLFRYFPFGLPMVARSTSRRRFAIQREAVERPDKFLSDLVVHCYCGTEPSPSRE